MGRGGRAASHKHVSENDNLLHLGNLEQGESEG